MLLKDECSSIEGKHYCFIKGCFVRTADYMQPVQWLYRRHCEEMVRCNPTCIVGGMKGCFVRTAEYMQGVQWLYRGHCEEMVHRHFSCRKGCFVRSWEVNAGSYFRVCFSICDVR